MRGWKFEHRSNVVERDLLNVSSFLGMIERLLAYVPRDLLAIDPCLRIAKELALALVPGHAVLALVILSDLLLIDA
ncbi:MAG: hypothetical protein ACLPZR_22340 [Solirubrobacteraceae bacterium]